MSAQQITRQVPAKPTPTAFDVKRQAMTDGTLLVLIEVHTPSAVAQYFMDLEGAQALGMKITAAGAGIVLPPGI